MGMFINADREEFFEVEQGSEHEYTCSNCGCEISALFNDSRCSNCGGRLDWSNV